MSKTKFFRKTVAAILTIGLVSSLIAMPTSAEDTAMFVDDFNSLKWTKVENSMTVIGIFTDDTGSSLKISNTSTGDNRNIVKTNEKINFEQGNFYKVTAKVKDDGANRSLYRYSFGTTSKKVYAYRTDFVKTSGSASYQQAYQNVFDYTWMQYALSGPRTKDTWTDMTTILYAQEDVETELAFWGFIYRNGISSAYLDDVRLEKINPVTSMNIIDAQEVELNVDSIDAPASGTVSYTLNSNIEIDSKNVPNPDDYTFALSQNHDGVSVDGNNLVISAGAASGDVTIDAKYMDNTFTSKTITIVQSNEVDPVAYDMVLEGSGYVGEDMSLVSYKYSDGNHDAESGTSFQWYRSSSENGQGTAIENANTREYTVTEDDIGMYVFIGVTPKNAKSTGAEVYSDYTKCFDSYTPDVSDRNLIWNGDMEQGTLGWNMKMMSILGEGEILNRSSEYSKSGKYSLYKNGHTANANLSHEVTMTKGKYYAATAWIKSDNTGNVNGKASFTNTSTTSDIVVKRFKQDFSATEQLSQFHNQNNNHFSISDGSEKMSDWMQIKEILYAEDNFNANIGIGFGNQAPQSNVWIDDVSIVETAPTFQNSIPKNVEISDEDINVDVTTTVHFGKEFPSVPAVQVTYELADAYEGVSINGSILTVSPTAHAGVIKINVKYMDTEYTHSINLTNGTDPLVENVTITGDTLLNEELTATPVAVNATTLSYQWYTVDPATDEKTAIIGANSSEFILTENEVGKYVGVGVRPDTGVEFFALADQKVDREVVDLILVTGQSNSRIYEEDGSNWYNGTNGNMMSIGRGEVYRYATEAGLLDYNDVPVGLTTNESGQNINQNDKNNLYAEGRAGIPYPIAKRWHDLTGKKTILVSTGVGGTTIESHRYNASASQGVKAGQLDIDQYRACIEDLEDRNMRVDKRLTFWLQGESNPTDTAETYYTKLMQMRYEYDAQQYCGVQDLFGVLTPRAWLSPSPYRWNTDDELYLTAARSVYYSLDSNSDDNMKLVSCITDELIGDDNVQNFFNDSYKFKDYFNSIGNLPTTDNDILLESATDAAIGHYTYKGYVALGLDAAQNAFDYLTNPLHATDITVRDRNGYVVNYDSVVTLDGNRTYLSATVYPVTAKEKVEFVENEYFDYSATTGHLIQKKPANGNVIVKFRAGSIEKEVTIAALQQNQGVKYNWDFNANTINDGLFANTSKGGQENMLIDVWDSANDRIGDGTVKNRNGYSLLRPILLQHNQEWTVRIKGVLSTDSSLFLTSSAFMKFSHESGSKDSIISMDSAAISIRSSKLNNNLIGKVQYSSINGYNEAEGATVKEKLISLLGNSDFHVYEVKNMKKADDSYGLFFGIDGSYYEFSTPLYEDVFLQGVFASYLFSEVDFVEVATNYSDNLELNATIDKATKRLTVSEVNNTENSVDRVIIVAVFDPTTGRLKETTIMDGFGDRTEFLSDATYECTLSEYSDGDTIRCFTWNNLIEIVPICDYQISVQ